MEFDVSEIEQFSSDDKKQGLIMAPGFSEVIVIEERAQFILFTD